MSEIIYHFGDGVYFNITNACPCKCVFCIRDRAKAVGDAKNLFHETQPDFAQIKAAVDAFDFKDCRNIVFCGYGEPTCAYDALIKTAAYLRQKGDFHLRLNTNGLSDLINGRPTAKEIAQHFDSVSVSMNAPDSDGFDAITRNPYPKKAFGAMLQFAKEVKDFGCDVRLSVVDVIGEEKVEQCRKIAEKLGVRFVCREYDKGRS